MDFTKFKNQFQKKPVTEFPHKVSKNPMVSVCIQTYNQVHYISQCLDSILMQQTNFEIEILLGEDASQDGTREICIEYAKKFPDKIRLFLHERENNIQVNKKNTGLFNSLYNLYTANGKYIAYCDGDDYWTDPMKLQQQVSFLEQNPKYVISYHKAIFVDSRGNQIDDEGYPQLSERDFSSTDLKKAIVQPIISTWCFRKVIVEIPHEFTRTIIADNFWISLLGFHGEGKYLPGIKPSHYRIHKEGIWSLINQDIKFTSKVISYNNISRHYAKRNENELARYFKRRSHNYLKMLILYYLKKPSLIKAITNSIVLVRSKLKKEII